MVLWLIFRVFFCSSVIILAIRNKEGKAKKKYPPQRSRPTEEEGSEDGSQELAEKKFTTPTVVKEHVDLMEKDSPKITTFGMTKSD